LGVCSPPPPPTFFRFFYKPPLVFWGGGFWGGGGLKITWEAIFRGPPAPTFSPPRYWGWGCLVQKIQLAFFIWGSGGRFVFFFFKKSLQKPPVWGTNQAGFGRGSGFFWLKWVFLGLLGCCVHCLRLGVCVLELWPGCFSLWAYPFRNRGVWFFPFLRSPPLLPWLTGFFVYL